MNINMKKIMLLTLISALLIANGCGKSDNTNENQHTNHENMQQGENHEGMHHETNQSQDIATQTVWKFSKETPKSNEMVELTIQINDKDGKPVKDFDIQHEKLMHLIVVSKDLSYFNHLHPEYKGDGLFTISLNFPAGGEYKLYADYVPKGTSKVVKNHTVTVGGEKAQTTPLKPDENLTKAVEGKEITLSFDELKAGTDVTLNFNIKDQKTGRPITNLQPYLGAVGHVVIISKDIEEYLHVHPMDEKAKGPDAKFMTKFPKSGIYKIWGQFQHEGKVITVPFVVKVS
jgi:major membrane immunogen (membrane-anchored lipoprotein)